MLFFIFYVWYIYEISKNIKFCLQIWILNLNIMHMHLLKIIVFRALKNSLFVYLLILWNATKFMLSFNRCQSSEEFLLTLPILQLTFSYIILSIIQNAIGAFDKLAIWKNATELCSCIASRCDAWMQAKNALRAKAQTPTDTFRSLIANAKRVRSHAN